MPTEREAVPFEMRQYNLPVLLLAIDLTDPSGCLAYSRASETAAVPVCGQLKQASSPQTPTGKHNKFRYLSCQLNL